MKNRAGKRRAKIEKVAPPYVFTLTGLGWIAILIYLLVQVDRSSVANSIFLQIPLLYIGGLLVSYGIVRSTKKTPNETTASQRNRIFFFAAGVSAASYVVYGWAYLFANGFH